MNKISARFKRLASASIAAAPLALFAGSADAILMATVDFDLTDMAAGTTVVDNGLGDFDDDLGSLLAIFNDPNSTSKITVTLLSDAPDARLIEAQIQANIASGADGTVTVSDDQYNLPAGQYEFNSRTNASEIDGVVLGVVTTVDGNIVLSVPSLVENAPNSSIETVALAGGDFTIKHVTSFQNTSGAQGTASFDTTSEVPEPSVLALLGVGLVGFGMRRLRSLQA